MPRQPTGRQPAGRQPTGRQPGDVLVTPAAFISGTILAATSDRMVLGGLVAEINLTAETWVAVGATFDAQRQNILDNLVSAQAEPNGFNALRASIPVSAVLRVSDTVVSITFPAFATYSITSDEVLTQTVPSTAVLGAVAYVASPTVRISVSGAGDAPGGIRRDIYDSLRSKQAFQINDIDRDHAVNL